MVLLTAAMALIVVACGAEGTAPPTPLPPTQTALPATPPPSPLVAEDAFVDGAESLAALTEDVFATLSTLIDELGPRESGTAQERRAAEYLKDRFEALGYTVALQPFTMERLTADGTSLELSTP